jgi:autotransporter strand-loop-strand O-heptosyltransferase
MGVSYSFNFGPMVDIQFGDRGKYLCEFFEHEENDNTPKLVHTTILDDMHFYKPYREWYTKWIINIYKIKDHSLKLVDCHYFNLQSKNVLFDIDFTEYNSILNSLNVINEFVKLYNCKGYIKLCIKNNNFENKIKEIFPVLILDDNDIKFYASYHIGKFDMEEHSTKKFGILESTYPQVMDCAFYYDSFRNKTNWENLTDAQVTCDILNIEYKTEYDEIKINVAEEKPQIFNKEIKIQHDDPGPIGQMGLPGLNKIDIKYLEGKSMKEKLINLYETTSINKQIKFSDKIDITFNFGPKVEILGGSSNEYKIDFIDSESNNIIHSDKIKPQHYTRVFREWYTDWTINVYKQNQLVLKHEFNLSNKNVFILLNSKSLGDTIAWFPYVEEFRKIHNCNIICATFWNKLFEKEYPKIKFIKPDTDIQEEIYASYKVGYELNKNLNRTDPRNLNLQEIACDILGLNFYDLGEIKPKITVKNPENRNKQKYVCIAPHSTAQSKYWNNENGWNDLVKYIKEQFNYNVFCISKEGNGYMKNKLPKGIVDKTGDVDIQYRITDIVNCEFFVGISTGLTWLAWALGKKVILISGCTSTYNEMTDCIRIFPKENVCTSCFNDMRFQFDKGVWDWCPVNKGTDKHFECSKVITAQQVIDEINSLRTIL